MKVAFFVAIGLVIFMVGVFAGMFLEDLRRMTPEERRDLFVGLKVAAIFVGALVTFLGFIGLALAKPEWI